MHNTSSGEIYILDEIPPLVAKPFSPDNVVPVEELGQIEMDEAFFGFLYQWKNGRSSGSCTHCERANNSSTGEIYRYTCISRDLSSSITRKGS